MHKMGLGKQAWDKDDDSSSTSSDSGSSSRNIVSLCPVTLLPVAVAFQIGRESDADAPAPSGGSESTQQSTTATPTLAPTVKEFFDQALLQWPAAISACCEELTYRRFATIKESMRSAERDQMPVDESVVATINGLVKQGHAVVESEGNAKGEFEESMRKRKRSAAADEDQDDDEEGTGIREAKRTKA
jgi:hypothetical protein